MVVLSFKHLCACLSAFNLLCFEGGGEQCWRPLRVAETVDRVAGIIELQCDGTAMVDRWGIDGRVRRVTW